MTEANPGSDPSKVEEWRAGNKLFEEGKYEEAVACYDRALRADPDYANARFNRCLARLFLRQYQLAIADVHWVMELEPARADARLLLGEIRSAMGERSLAIQNYREALKLDPALEAAKHAIERLEQPGPEPGSGTEAGDSRVRPTLRLPGGPEGPGRAHDRPPLEIPTVAELSRPMQDETLVGAIERNLHTVQRGQSTASTIKRAVLLGALHRREAGPCWEEVFDATSDFEALLRAVRCYYEQGEWDEVLRLKPAFEREIEGGRRSQEAVRILADALLARGHAEPAAKLLETVRDPTGPTLLTLAGVRLALGQEESAVRVAEAACTRAPSEPRAATVRSIANRSWFAAVRPLDGLEGLTAIKAQLRERVVLPLLVPEVYVRGIPTNKFLMMGPPGCGKTSLARVAAREAHASFRAIHLSAVLNLYTGNSEANMSAAFIEAKDATQEGPVVLFIDEVDSIAVSRERMVQAGEHRLINHFMDELDQVRAFPQLMVLAATNLPFELDPAVIRSGRLGTPIYVGPPDAVARESLISKQLALLGAPELDARALALELEWFSPADIEQGFATFHLSRNARRLEGLGTPLTLEQLEAAFRGITPSVRIWFTAIANRFAQDPMLEGLLGPDLRKDIQDFLARSKRTSEARGERSQMFG